MPLGVFDPSLVALGWFDPSLDAMGWLSWDWITQAIQMVPETRFFMLRVN